MGLAEDEGAAPAGQGIMWKRMRELESAQGDGMGGSRAFPAPPTKPLEGDSASPCRDEATQYEEGVGSGPWQNGGAGAGARVLRQEEEEEAEEEKEEDNQPATSNRGPEQDRYGIVPELRQGGLGGRVMGGGRRALHRQGFGVGLGTQCAPTPPPKSAIPRWGPAHQATAPDGWRPTQGLGRALAFLPAPAPEGRRAPEEPGAHV